MAQLPDMDWQWGQGPWKRFPYVQVSDVLCHKPIPIIYRTSLLQKFPKSYYYLLQLVRLQKKLQVLHLQNASLPSLPVQGHRIKTWILLQNLTLFIIKYASMWSKFEQLYSIEYSLHTLLTIKVLTQVVKFDSVMWHTLQYFPTLKQLQWVLEWVHRQAFLWNKTKQPSTVLNGNSSKITCVT